MNKKAMNKKVIVFGGTKEGREICEYLCANGMATTVCVATDYGSFCVEQIEGLEILEGRLREEEIRDLIIQYDYVVDASHPYAQVISENIKKAYKACHKSSSMTYLRISRESQEEKGRVFFDWESLCAYLEENQGNVLVTTGSKDLEHLQGIENYQERIYPRILPAIESLEKAIGLGFKKSNIICMQGPFSLEMNVAMLRSMDARYMVTKDTGNSGGFGEKLQAAKETKVELLTIGRPSSEAGITLEEAKNIIRKNESRFREA